MKTKDFQRPGDLIRSLSPQTLLAVADLCDGHTIFKPEIFTRAGLPPEVVMHLMRLHRSDGSPKGTIFVNGEPVPGLCGVYGLDLLRFVAGALDVDYRPALGRGFEASNIQHALRQHFQQGQKPPAE